MMNCLPVLSVKVLLSDARSGRWSERQYCLVMPDRATRATTMTGLLSDARSGRYSEGVMDCQIGRTVVSIRQESLFHVSSDFRIGYSAVNI